MKGLGDKVRDLRKTKRLTLVEVAKSSGIDQATKPPQSCPTNTALSILSAPSMPTRSPVRWRMS